MNRTKYLDRAHGHVYFRVKRKRLGRLPGAEGSSEFNAAYDAFLAQTRDLKTQHRASVRELRLQRRDPSDVRVASIEWFIEKYLASDFFVSRNGRDAKFSRGTQINYRAGLEDLRTKTYGNMTVPLGRALLADLTPEAVDVYLATVARERSDTVARLHKILLSNLWKFARGFAEFKRGGKTNPLADAGERYSVEQEHEPWPKDVRDRFLAACDSNLYLAYHLLLCTGQRVSDVASLKWSQYDGTHIRLTQQKTETPLTIKVPKVLRALLAKTDRVHENILTHRWGRPYTRDSLGHRIKDVLIANGDGRYTTHGLRKNAGIMLAENGATVQMIMAALGHTTPKLALYYCRLANQRLLNEQAAAIIDDVFEREAADKAAKVAARRAQIRRV